jgi:hypothetical protein
LSFCLLYSEFCLLLSIDLTPFLSNLTFNTIGRVNDNPLLGRIYRINRIGNCGIRGGQRPGSAAPQRGKTPNEISNIEYPMSKCPLSLALLYA